MNIRHEMLTEAVEIISEFLASPEAKTDEHSAVERPLGADRETQIAADE